MAPRTGSRVACYFQSLRQITVALNCGLDVIRVLDVIVQTTAQALAARGCAIWLLNPERRELSCAASYGLSGRYLPSGPVKVDLTAQEVLSGKSVLVLDASIDPCRGDDAESVEEGIGSILSVPIRLRGEALGVVRVHSAEQRDFAPEEIEFAEATAALAATALQNAPPRWRREQARSDCPPRLRRVADRDKRESGPARPPDE